MHEEGKAGNVVDNVVLLATDLKLVQAPLTLCKQVAMEAGSGAELRDGAVEEDFQLGSKVGLELRWDNEVLALKL